MIFKTYSENININETIISKYAMDDMAYFDIETTGFDKESESIILISLGFFKKDRSFFIKQYFAESLDEEIFILKSFIEDLLAFSRWCSFNGMAFDAPFIFRKLTKYELDKIAPAEHIDLYRLIRPYHKSIGIGGCNLKVIENYLGIEREDKIHGGECVELYMDYLENKSEELLQIILLHNYEDVLNLPKLFNLIDYIDKDETIKRDDIITNKQVKYLSILLCKHNIDIKLNINKISKKCATRVIDEIIKGNYNSVELTDIILSSY